MPSKPNMLAESTCKPYHEPIDLVITWVNGSDPRFIKELSQIKGQDVSEIESNRFKDMNQLKYTIRSFEKYAPWIRNIVLLTNGQGNVTH